MYVYMFMGICRHVCVWGFFLRNSVYRFLQDLISSCEGTPSGM